jgi:hypothetical protein
MRHALVPVHLMHSARTAAARFDADPELDELEAHRARRVRWGRRSRRVATRTRRVRP